MRAKKGIPIYVVNWTDKYFHNSYFDDFLPNPNEKVVHFLSKYKKTKPIMLFRGVNCFNMDNKGIQSWTYDKEVAIRYGNLNEGFVLEKEFVPDQVLFDTTLLSIEEKLQLGYDYETDDKEVLIKQL